MTRRFRFTLEREIDRATDGEHLLHASDHGVACYPAPLPLPLLAHQAPILPLKLWRPAAFNGTALVIGSIAPDLEYLRMTTAAQAHRGFAHSIAGQFLFCLPVTLAVVLLVGRLRLGEVLAARLGSRFAWLAGAATDVACVGGLRRAAVSALVGSFSHIAFDALTHSVLLHWLPGGTVHVGHVGFSYGTLVNLIASGVGALVSLWLLHRIALRAVKETPAPRRGRAAVAGLALMGGVVGVFRARQALRNPDAFFDAGRLYVWGYVAFLAACGAGAGVLLAGIILAAWDQRARVG